MNWHGNLFQGAPCQGFPISRINPNVQTSIKTNEWLKSDVRISASRTDLGTIAWCPNPLPASLLVPHFPQSWGFYIILLLSCPTTLILVSQISSIPIPYIPPHGFPNSHPQMSRLTPPHVQIIYIVESRLPPDDSTRVALNGQILSKIY